MNSARKPVIAGTFYPADAEVLASGIRQYLRAANPASVQSRLLIAPHAGHIYSGPIAAQAYRAWETDAAHIRRVILVGPSHRVAFTGLALPSQEAFLTPLGAIPIDRDACTALLRLPQVIESDVAHAQEHSLEVHLPFLQQVLGEFTLVPLVAGQATADQVCEVLELFYDDPETGILISTDLSHFHPYAEAQRIDANTTQRIQNLCTDLRGGEACGHIPVNGALQFARQNGLQVQTLDVRNSGDTAGRNMRDRVVGYGAYVLH